MSHPQSTFSQTAFTGKTLLSVRRDIVRKTSMHTQLEQLKTTGRYDCFKLKWHPIYEDHSMWPVPFHLFWDSDIAKWIEAACYWLQESYVEEIDKAVQELVEMIRGAQHDDGYLNVHYTVVEPDKRWTNVKDMHELYNAGHLLEAALAHKAYYNNDLLMEPILKYVDHINKTFGPAEGQLHGYPGHPEIELALFRLWGATGNQSAYDLAKYFLEERGNPKGQDGEHYYLWETKQRKDHLWARPDSYPMHDSYWVNQAHVPIFDQKTIEGHSVRAAYLLVGVADLCYFDQIRKPNLSPHRKEWQDSLIRLWNNMVDQKMYLTGGIGSIKQWEGFSVDHFLPQSTDEGGCYSETCASIAVMMLAERLLQLELDGRYGDVLELSLYNVIMTAMSLSGKEFTYENQLASSETDKSQRFDWFWCACCPPNLARLYGSLGGYLWDYGARAGAYVNVHLYTSAKLTFEVDGKTVVLEQESHWPLDGKVNFKLSTEVQTTLRLRLPAWAQGKFTIEPSPKPEEVTVSKGYIELSPGYTSANPSFTLEIGNFEPRYISPHPHTNQNTLTLARGPIIYCAEDVDNSWETNHFKDTILRRHSPVTEERRVSEQTGEECIALKSKCWKRVLTSWDDKPQGATPGIAAADEEVGEEREITFVPYYFRANRGGKGHMRVGFLKG
ncbi:hypothetical protein FSARC_10760 [Fusarium sarcochroum]|uniref:Glycosyl hydrolase n=1 Tax=Fusarium sarcochroum TaxID=1208366 RepID=A0A8H4TK68_9HYPO|nr:hypothetical protein FSARC_10760 [Fusarium sarcochroum]